MTGVFLDSLVSANLGHGFQAMMRPQIQRIAATTEWNRQVWVADLRYEREGPLAFRVEAGYIPSPIGLANLTLRPQLNPTIAQPASLFTSIGPSAEFRGPRVNLLSGLYPLGAQATVSTVRWDARVAIMDTSPLRLRRVFGAVNPPRFPNLVVGGGITPFVGFRIGASVARGGWLRAGESPAIAIDHSATVATVETELSFRHTAIAGEWTHDALETPVGGRSISGWYVQAAQTLMPRLFVAGRVERMQTTLPAGLRFEQTFTASEQTLGFRISPEITFRVSHRAAERFGGSTYAHTGAISLVWYRRWM
jgi:hypothetical protein